jgi:hypothetical protein
VDDYGWQVDKSRVSWACFIVISEGNGMERGELLGGREGEVW